jgi:hypothetical protein
MKSFKEIYSQNPTVINRELRLLNALFASDDEIKPQFTFAMQQGDYIYSTDTRLLIQVPKANVFNEYKQAQKNVPDLTTITAPTIELKKQKTYETWQLRQALNSYGMADSHALLGIKLTTACKECYATGYVSYTYRAEYDRQEYEQRAECPICDGSGEMPIGQNKLISICAVDDEWVDFNADSMARMYAALFHFDCEKFSLIGMKGDVYTFMLGDNMATVTQMAVIGELAERYTEKIKMK